ncbi:polysaccharide lyase family 1 protein [Uliginosibacterium sp. 31-16]|uniref:pectate lyase family protein n=1 Tax=Uliginosibacterium sp. 31-16 TaxID=3068315 RepID=UPI00273DD36B|nr:polysaccharide lyase family 1 protein [Uliginosibacterium sp. 31-16]MDP5239656.1 polysaccharide lyase family 1 protein [Uliginosibacterium sp. 31-16]
MSISDLARHRLAPVVLSLSLAGLLSACGGGGGGSSSSEPTPTAPEPTIAVVSEVSGWASQGTGTTGGALAPATNIYKVTNRAELLAALANTSSPTYLTNQTAAKSEPKIIYVSGSIYGTDLGNGSKADLAYYRSLSANAAKWDWDLYIQSLDKAYMADLDAKVALGDAAAIATKAKIADLSSGRTTVMNLQKAQIQFPVPSNTSIIGVGKDAKLIDGYLAISAVNNVIVRNMEFEAPTDLATAYQDGDHPEWNARYDAISLGTAKQIWIDHCTLSDGKNLDTEVLTINGVTLPVQRHDGLLDIEDGADYVTVSYTEFKNHDKTSMVGGSGDSNGFKERDVNRLTFSYNRYRDSVQRSPRARFGKIHVYNNYYSGNTDDAVYPMLYYIGMGAESRILSGTNAFDITGSKASASRVISNLNGYQFKDVGSWFNGTPASTELEAAAKAALDARWSDAQSEAATKGFTLAAYTNVLGWTPTYAYAPAPSAAALRTHVDANAGAGRLAIDAPAGAAAPGPILPAPPATNVCPAEWSSLDSGIANGTPFPAVYGFLRDTTELPVTVGASYSAGKYTLVSAGSLAGAGDGLTLAYKKVSGNFTLVAQLESMEVPATLNSGNIVAGIMLRNDANPRSLYYSMMLRGSKSLRTNFRDVVCGSAGNTAIVNVPSLPTAAAPLWMKMQRTGQVMQVSYSYDGLTWVDQPSKDFTATPLATEVYVGLAGSSGTFGTSSVTTSSVFSGVSLTQ